MGQSVQDGAEPEKKGLGVRHTTQRHALSDPLPPVVSTTFQLVLINYKVIHGLTY